MGNNTLKINVKIHQDNRQKLCKALKAKYPDLPKGAYIFLQGGSEAHKYDTDTSFGPFIQVCIL